MAARKPKSWLLKPQPGTPLNWDHPLARFLINRWAATEGAGTKLTDSAGRANATTSGTWVQGPYGPMVAYNGSSQAASAVGVKYKSAATLTVAFTYYRATNPNTYNMIMESSADLGSNFNGSWNIWDGYNGATNTQGNFMTVSIAATVAGNQATSAAIAQPAAGRVHRIVAVIDRRLTTNQITAIYVDGVSQSITYGTPVASKVTQASTFTDYTMYFAARGGTSFYNNCRLDDVTFSTRLWTPADASTDYVSRYGMYVPPRLHLRSSFAGQSVTVAVTGVTGTGSVGTVSVTAGAATAVTGVTGTGDVGTVTVAAGATTSVTGVSATGSVGTATAVGGATTAVTGVSATGSVGTANATGGATLALSGIYGTGEIGTVTAGTTTAIAVTGVTGTGSVGTAAAVGGATTAVTGVSATGSVGTVTVDTLINVAVTGVYGTGQLGTVAFSGGATAFVTGVTGTTLLNNVLVWGLVDDTQTPNWQNISTLPVSGWSQVSTSPTTDWSQIPT